MQWFVRNPRARLALAYAIDRRDTGHEVPGRTSDSGDSPLLPGSWAYEPGDFLARL